MAQLLILSSGVSLMLGQRHRRCANIKLTLDQRLVLQGTNNAQSLISKWYIIKTVPDTVASIKTTMVSHVVLIWPDLLSQLNMNRLPNVDLMFDQRRTLLIKITTTLCYLILFAESSLHLHFATATVILN